MIYDMSALNLRNLYTGLAENLWYENLGAIMAKGCGSPETVHGSRYTEEAYRLGKKLKITGGIDYDPTYIYRNL